MKQMTPAAVERAMKLQDVMLRAMAKRITWYQAAEILGISGRQMLRWQTRFKHEGYGGLFDRRMAGLRMVIEQQGVFCALYSDRASHFFLTPKAGEPVDHHRLTQVGRALRELGIQMIPAYSPQARGRSERGFSTWQGRLPPELRARKIKTLEEANRFLRQQYVQEFNHRFSKAASERGTAFVPLRRKDLDLVFSLQHERIVARDNTVSFANKIWQLERSKLRATLCGCRVTIHQHLDETISITLGPHLVGRYNSAALPLGPKTKTV